MFEASVNEFPFVAGLPKREKSKIAQVWDEVHELEQITKTEGQLIPVTIAAKCLDIGRTRVDELCAQGVLRRFTVCGHVYISAKSVMERAEAERSVGGRGNKLETFGDAVRAAFRPSRK